MTKNNSEPTVLAENSPAPASPRPEKEAWQRPTLESLDVADTQAKAGFGTDGGGISKNLS